MIGVPPTIRSPTEHFVRSRWKARNLLSRNFGTKYQFGLNTRDWIVFRSRPRVRFKMT
jgi:hypothetical protein